MRVIERMTISVVARAVGVTVKTLKRWEQLSDYPQRKPKRHPRTKERFYTAEDVAAILHWMESERGSEVA